MIAIGHFWKFLPVSEGFKIGLSLIERRYLAATLHYCLHILHQSSLKRLQTRREVMAAPTQTDGCSSTYPVQQGWPRLCGTGLSCQSFRLPSRNPLWQVSVHRSSRYVCVVPVTHRLQLEPKEHGEERPKCSGLFCAWRSSKSCSLCTHALVKSVEWKRFLWICTSFVCRKVDSTPWCPLRPSWLPAVPQPHPALPWQPFCCWLRVCTHASLSAVSFPGTWTADTPRPWEAMCLYCAAIWWERQLLVQLGNESLEGPPLGPSLSSNSAHPSPGFMNPLVTQFSSAKQHGSTTCATCCSGGKKELLNLHAAVWVIWRCPLNIECCWCLV